MASPSGSGASRFLPSPTLARLALEASLRRQPPALEQPHSTWVTSLPAADFIDMGAWFGPGYERLEATPEGLPGPHEDVVERVQQAIGTRVERLLSSFAFEAAARKETTFAVTEDERFTDPIHDALLKSLPVEPSKAAPVLARLAQDLRAAAHDGTFRGDWGLLRDSPKSLSE